MSQCVTPTIPGAADYQACECDPSPNSCSDFFTSCRNPLYHFDHQDECGALSLTALTLVPDALDIPEGRSGYVRTIATFSDGRVADVTGETAFGTDDPDISESMGAGILTGESVGTTGVTGTWRGKLARGEVNVFDNECAASAPWDVVIVADDSGIFRAPPVTAGGSTGNPLRRYWTNMAAAYPQAILALEFAMDLYGMGDFVPGSGWDNSIPAPSSIGGTRTGTDRVAIVGVNESWSDTVTPYDGVGSSDIGAGLMQALQLHFTGRSDVRKLVVLFSTGGETSCSPGIAAAAAVLALNGILLAVVTPLGSTDQVFSACSAPDLAWQVLSDAASTCLFFDSIRGATLANPFSTVLRIACEGCSSGGGIGIGLI